MNSQVPAFQDRHFCINERVIGFGRNGSYGASGGGLWIDSASIKHITHEKDGVGFISTGPQEIDAGSGEKSAERTDVKTTGPGGER